MLKKSKRQRNSDTIFHKSRDCSFFCLNLALLVLHIFINKENNKLNYLNN